MLSPLATRLGERKLARLIGVTDMVIASLIAAKPVVPRASALGSLAAVGMFATTMSLLVTTPEAWQETHRDQELSPAGQFLIKDVVFLGASLLTAAASLQAAQHS
jgi:reactive chlorine resistance protein C